VLALATTMARHVDVQRISFTSYGLLHLLPGEHRELVLEEAEIHPADSSTIGPDGENITGTRGRLEITTQRLTWVEPGSSVSDPKRSCSLPILALQSASMSTGQLFSATEHVKMLETSQLMHSCCPMSVTVQLMITG
jgi:hypothetical protein